MMPVELQSVKKLIAESVYLSAIERAEWTQLLNEMNDRQIRDLVRLLTPAPKVQAAPYRNPVNIQQKELTTSIPEHELDLPQPKPFMAPELKTLQQATPKSNVQPPVDLATLLKNKKIYEQVKPEPTKEAPTPISQEKNQELYELELDSPDDFANLECSILHGKDPYRVLQQVLDIMMALSKKMRAIPIINNIYNSPLYKTYVATGMALLNDPNPDREAVYERLEQENTDYMTKDEFEAFTDFRKELEKLVV